MATKRSGSRSLTRSRAAALFASLSLACAVFAGACGGATERDPLLGGESHFLRSCTTTCGNALDCISGVCTRGCVVGGDSCSALTERATCTSDSFEPGAVAVCDVACSVDANCNFLGTGYRCDGAFCRGVDISQITLPPPGECPPPQASPPGILCASVVTWTKDPRPGAQGRRCCEYGDPCALPSRWPQFSSEEECQNDCLCDAVERDDSIAGTSVARSSLACHCDRFTCPSNVVQAIGDACVSGATSLSRGCGMILVTSSRGFSGGSNVFDESSGALIGSSYSSDVQAPPCFTFNHRAGVEFECASAVSCNPCETADPLLPFCEPR
jgi:hypothetical protein